MLQDIQFGLKMLLKQKAFTIAALLTLALCIGANTAIFAVLEGVVLRPLSYPESDRLVTLYNIYPGVGVTDHGANARPDYFDRRQLKDVFSEVTLFGSDSYELGQGGEPRRVEGGYVTPSFFTVLGVRPMLGRAFTEAEGVKGKEKVVVITEGLWREQFGRAADVLSRDLRLNGAPYRVVGVMPDSFALPGDDARLWIPFALGPEDQAPTARHANSWRMLARLRPGVSIERARARIDALNRANLDSEPRFKQLIIDSRFATVVRFWKDELTRDIRPTLYLLQIAAGVVLLIGCVNLANLMLARANQRMREMAIRFSLGAGRWRIARQLLVESLMLAVSGAVLGVALGRAGIAALLRLGAADLPRGAGVSLDAGTLLFTAAVALLVGVAFGLAPLVHVMRSDLNEVFRGNERGGTAGRGAARVRSALVACQFAFAFVLLIGAALLTLTFQRVLRVDPGFEPAGVTTARLNLPRARYEKDEAMRAFIASFQERLSRIPGVTAAGLTDALPFSGNKNSSVMEFAGHSLAPGETPPTPSWTRATAGYIPAMGIRLVAGRNFTGADGPDAPKVAIIDEYLAQRYFPHTSPLGQQLRRGLAVGGSKPDLCTIVGVVRTVKNNDLTDGKAVGQLYFSALQYPGRNLSLAVRGPAGQAALLAAIRNELRQADPQMPLTDEKAMPERLSKSVSSRRAAMALCLVFGGLALLLAAIGVYGVLAYSVSQRTREFGVRMALGASAGEVVWIVVSQGFGMAAAGLGAGAIGALAVTRLMGSLLYGVRPADPAAFACAALALAAVAAAAALASSARAARIPPATALRYE